MRSIQLEEDLAFERRSWVVQRVAWVAIFLFVAAAALGFLGSSALSKRTVEREGIKVEYEKLSRERAPAEMMLTISPPFPGKDEVGVWFAGDFFKSISIEDLVPEPVRATSEVDQLRFVFALSNSDKPIQIRMDYQPEASGRLEARLGLSGGRQRVDFRVFVYP